MKKLITALIILIIMAFLNAKPSYGQNSVSHSAQLRENFPVVDNRSQILKEYLEKSNSPLAENADEFVKAADAYELDWRLLAAITGVESTYGKFIPKNSYNAYGWNNGNYYFDSWPDSIWYVSKILKQKYIDQGADTVYKIGRIYAPPSPFWPGKVIRLMDKINSEPQFTLDL